MKNKNVTEQRESPAVELSLENDRPMASSTQIAWHFNKRHADVLRAIENIKTLISDDNYHERNFAFMSLETEAGHGAVRQSPAYLMTRDGFALLAMGFTGKRAMAWKIKYIEAFNRMEAALRDKREFERMNLKQFNPPDETEEQRRERHLAVIEGLLGFWALQSEIPYHTAENMLCAHLDICGLHRFTSEHFSPAWDFIIQCSCFLENEGRAIDEQVKSNLETILSSCSSFKHTRDLDVKDMLARICGASLENMPSAAPHKLTAIAWGLFHYASGFNLGRAHTLQEVADHAQF